MRIIEAMDHVNSIVTSAGIVHGAAATVKSSWSEGRKDNLLGALESISMRADFLKADALALIAEIGEE